MMRFSLIMFAAVGCGTGRISLDKDADDETGKEDTDTASDTATDSGDSADTGGPVGEELTATITYTGPEPLFGFALDEGDIDGDVRDDLLVGAPGVERGGSGLARPGSVLMIAGPITLAESEWSPTVTFHGIADGDAVGTSIAHGDWNGDGAMDVAIGGGMPTTTDPAMVGFVAVASGPFANDVALSHATLLSRDNASDAFGYAQRVADLTNDGFDDIAVGAPGGLEVVIYAGSTTGIGQSSTSVVTGTDGTSLGEALATGDVDADGISDLLVGAPDADGEVSNSGAAYLFVGPFEGSLALPDAAEIYSGVASGDRLGASVAIADLNNDGRDDAIVGAPEHDGGGMNAGIVVVFTTSPDAGISAEGSASYVGDQPGSEAGTSVSFAHDMNSDGNVDMVVGAPMYDEESLIDAGRGYLVLGPFDGQHSLKESAYVVGRNAGGELGRTVLGDTELSGDSIADFLLAAPSAGEETQGAVDIITGY